MPRLALVRAAGALVALTSLATSQHAPVALPWAFTPWRAVDPPAVSDPDWQQALDRYVLAAQQQRGLDANPRADFATLLRRAAYVLTALPPTADQRLLGLDHERLTFRHAGRDFRLTDVEGVVAKALLA